MINGLINTKLRNLNKPYDPNSWWDSSFYVAGVSDRKTISPTKGMLPSLYHYCSVEQLILKHLINSDFDTKNISVLDIGSGAGHWIDFWKRLGAAKTDGIDVSQACIDQLSKKYSNDDSVSVYQGEAVDIIQSIGRRYAVVNAIGVMFHIVEDSEWLETLSAVSDSLKPNGIFIVGGHFGLLNGVNVQVDHLGRVNKRLRSNREWRKRLKDLGFRNCSVYRNRAYLGIDPALPENNILVAQK